MSEGECGDWQGRKVREAGLSLQQTMVGAKVRRWFPSACVRLPDMFAQLSALLLR